MLVATFCRDQYLRTSSHAGNTYQMHAYINHYKPNDARLPDLADRLRDEQFEADIWAVTFMNLTGLKTGQYQLGSSRVVFLKASRFPCEDQNDVIIVSF